MPGIYDRLVTSAASATSTVVVNSTLATSGGGGSAEDVEIYQQCDHGLLFAHLAASFQLGPLVHTYNSVLNSYGASSTPAGPLDRTAAGADMTTHKLGAALVCTLFGTFFAVAGYRLLKLATFIVGFFLGASVIYLILSEQKQLSQIENLVISLSIGVLFAFVALLIQYIGLFLIGITSSTAVVTCALIFIDLFYTNKSAWLCIGLLFLCATVVASFSLKFQRFFAIVNTSCIGAALLMIAVDFFVENNLLVEYIFELYKVNGNTFNFYQRLNGAATAAATASTTSTTIWSSTTTIPTRSSVNGSTSITSDDAGNIGGGTRSALALFMRLYSSAHAKLCWFTWLIFGSFFALFVVSLLVQCLVTARDYDHRPKWQKLIRGNRKKKTANLEKIRLDNGQSSGSSGGGGGRRGEVENSNDSLLAAGSGSGGKGHRSGRHHHHHHHHGHHHHHKRSGENSVSGLRYTPSSDDVSVSLAELEAAQRPRPQRRKGEKSRSAARAEPEDLSATASMEMIAIEVIKPSSSAAAVKKSKLSRKDQKSSSCSSTTTASSSSSSSSSSTCHLLPTAAVARTADQEPPVVVKVQPSAPPLPQSPVPSQGALVLPPPVPTVPPPKLSLPLTQSPVGSLEATTTTSESGSLMLQKAANLAKLKHHRSSKDKESAKTSSSSSSSPAGAKVQIRRNNGDVLSRDFLTNMQSKKSSADAAATSTAETAPK